jgi:hypothetical protein
MEFIVSEIADQAIRAGTPLSETERKMLFFSESAPNARELADLAEAFDREYDQDEYERKIASLIRAARKRADKTRAAAWSAALQRLDASDRYLGAMLDETVRSQSVALSRRGVVAVLVLLAGFVLYQVGLGWYLGHTPARDEEAFYTWLAAMAFAVAYVASRWALGAGRVDGFIGRVLDVVFRAPKE